MTVAEVKQIVLDYLAERGEKGVTAYELSRRPMELPIAGARDVLLSLWATRQIRVVGRRIPSIRKRNAMPKEENTRVYALKEMP